jgi:hypothetical protein
MLLFVAVAAFDDCASCRIRSWHTMCITSTERELMELMEVYHEAMAKWIIARATDGKCEGSEFVFELIESAIRKEAAEILLIPVHESDMVRVDFGRLHCYYRQPGITRAQFAYVAIYIVLIGNVAAEEARTERLFRGPDEGLYNLQFEKIRLPDSEPAVVIYIEPLRNEESEL